MDRLEIHFELAHGFFSEPFFVVGESCVYELLWNVEVAHAKQVVVDEEFEDVRNVRLVWLEHLVKNHSALKKIGHAAKKVRVVQLDP